MRKYQWLVWLIGIALNVLLHSNLNAQVSYKLNNTNAAKYSIEKQGEHELSVCFAIDSIFFGDVEKAGENYTTISINNFTKPYGYGEPNLPILTKILTFPKGTKVSLQKLTTVDEIIDLFNLGIRYDLVPTIPSISKSEDDGTKKAYVKGASYFDRKYYSKPVIALKYKGQMGKIELYELSYSPIAYNAQKHKIKVANNVKVVLSVKSEIALDSKAVIDATTKLPALYKKAYFNAKESFVPETYVIVTDPSYKKTIQAFVKLKQQLGFHVICLYVGEDIVSAKRDDIKKYLQDLYENPPIGYEAFTNLLLVGGIDKIPSWSGETENHVTDLYYAEYTNDFLPEVMYGRMAFDTEEELENIIEKNIVVQLGLAVDRSYQNKHVLVAGVDSDMATVYGNGAVNYFKDYYSNDSLGITPSYYLYGSGSPILSNSTGANEAILNDYNKGAGIVYYSAHCNPKGWDNPAFKNNDISNISNNGKYPLMISNCCESFSFNYESFGESIVKAKNKGAVAYIGASNYSYWDEDYFWAIGFTNNIIAQPSYVGTEIGAMDAWFHTHNEPENEWAQTAAQILWAGNMAVEASASNLKDYYWEIYHVSGDPSIVAPKYAYENLQASYDPVIVVGQNELKIQTEAFVVGTIFDNDSLIGYGKADANGLMNLSFEAVNNLSQNAIQLTLSHALFNPLLDTLQVIPPNGPFVALSDYAFSNSKGDTLHSADYGDTLFVSVKLENYGQEAASNIVVKLTDYSLEISPDIMSFTLEALNPHESKILTNAFYFVVSNKVKNNVLLKMQGEVNYTADAASNFAMELYAKAPNLTLSYFEVDNDFSSGNRDGIIDNNERFTLDLAIENIGFADAKNVLLRVESADTTQLKLIDKVLVLNTIKNDSVQIISLDVQAGIDLFPGSTVWFSILITAGEQKQYLFNHAIELTLGEIPNFNMLNDALEVVTAWFYDSEGPNNYYLNKDSLVTTFLPYEKDEALMVDFVQFDIERNTLGGCWDKLKVYNGADTLSPLIGSYCNSNKPLQVISQNPQGALTFSFQSDGDIRRAGWEAFISSQKVYKLNFKVSDDFASIDSAVVVFGSGSDTTNATGDVTFNHVIANQSNRLIIKRDGYFDYTNEIEGITSDTNINVLMKSLPNVCFFVTANGNVLSNTEVVFNGDTLITNEEGKANFDKIIPGKYNFKLTKQGFVDSVGSVEVVDFNVNLYISMLDYFVPDLTFKISDYAGNMEGVKIALDNGEERTTVEGAAVFEELLPGWYSYSVTKEGYVARTDVVEVKNSDKMVEVIMEIIKYEAEFTIWGANAQKLSGATVTIDSISRQTNENGVAHFSHLIPNKNIPFTVQHSAYSPFVGAFDITKNNVSVMVNLNALGLTNNEIAFELIPNPASQNTLLQVDHGITITALKVYTLSGILINRFDNLSGPYLMDVSHYESGIYIIEIVRNDRRIFKKLLIE